ncbi:hypothetical protein [Wolbachia endosymbiont of Wuchereria bancrofti]|uniref:hypothetical protein n=1 Tax=Wolbachia endosymbiont of Wuchereria bancrofti TaxID=96496 RepID=UPI000B4CFD65|nr:hypothetical protein [Wolbachia endosymbiont of Wuchereria bancrofti]
MMAHIKEASDTNFSEMYGPLFPSKENGKGTWIDWKAAFKQQKLLEAESNVVLLEISYSLLKENQLYKEEVGTKLDNIIKNNQGNIRKGRQLC